MLRNSVQMSWIVVLLYVSSFLEGFTAFGNLEDDRLSPVVQQRCVLPQYPESGGYVVINETNARPEDAFDEVSLIMYTSDEEFKLEIVYFTCIRGAWSREVLKSVRKHIWPIKPDTGAHLKNQEKSPDATINSECCKLPSHPEHGIYIVAGDAAAKPGDEFTSVNLEYICDEGFSVSGKTHIRCENGTWFDEAPECVKMIKLPDDGGQVQSRFSMNNESHTCKLPPQPKQGHYIVEVESYIDLGYNSTFLGLRYFCLTGYGIDGNDYVECSDGMWSEELPTCIEGCNLEDVPGVSYLCKEENSDEFSTFCSNYKPYCAEVAPICNTPYYRSSEELPPMKCVDGKWNYTPSCLPECGIQHSGRRFRQVQYAPTAGGGIPAMKRELPWHVGIYSKLYQPYMQICSGSIISPKLVVTAAHCFWNDLEGLEPGSRFAVAAGKLYRPWGTPYDFEAQFSDVKDIVIPKRFRGAQTNFQDDIAIIYLSNSFVFNMDVWPVCIDFDLNSDRKHLTVGNLGKVAGWGLTKEDGKPSPVLQVVNLPYVEIDQCIADASPDFRAYITSDKICAGYTNGTALCKGDSGGGLAFAETEGRYKRFYLRGIASTAPNNDKLCNTHTVTTFTQILAHEHFIKDHFNFSTV